MVSYPPSVGYRSYVRGRRPFPVSGGAGATAQSLLAGYYDDFVTGSNGTINGRTIAGLVSYTTILEQGSISNKNVLTVNTAGKGTLTGTTGANTAHAFRNPTTVRDYAMTRILGGTSVEDHDSPDGALLTNIRASSTIGVSGTVALTIFNAGVSAATALITVEQPQSGDYIDRRTITRNGIDYLEYRFNGKPVGVSGGIMQGASFTAHIDDGAGNSGTLLTVTAVSSGTIRQGDTVVSNGSLTGDHQIGTQVSGTTGGTGVYNITGTGVLVTSATITTTVRGVPLAANGVTLTGQSGWLGSLSANTVDANEGGDPTVVNRLVVIRTGRVAAREPDGTVILRGAFEYTGSAPTALKCRLFIAGASTVVDTIVSGFDGVPVSSFTVDDTTKTGTFTLPAFTPVSLSTLYHADVYREDAADANGAATVIAGHTPNILPGNVWISTGESLMTLANSGSGTTNPYTPPGNTVWQVSANSSAALLVRTNKPNGIPANSPPASFFSAISPLFPVVPSVYIMGGLGGTALYRRSPGPLDIGPYDAIKQATILMGNRVTGALNVDGHDDVGISSAYGKSPEGIAGYKTRIQAQYADLTSLSGAVFPVFMGPVAAAYGNADAPYESMRRFQGFELPSIDSRYKISAFLMDLQHVITTGTDPLHFNVDGYAEMMRRLGFGVLHNFDPTTYPNDRSGPSISSVAKIDDHTLDVTFALNGFTGFVASPGVGINGEIDQYNGGMRFGTAVSTSPGVTMGDGTTPVTTISTEVYPNAAPSIGTPSGGFVVVRFTFAAGTFPGTAYVSGPYGSNPFNRTNDSTVNASFASLASMLQGTISGEPNVAIRPYWNGSADYLGAS